LTARVTVLGFGDVRILALPGEPFAVTARQIAARLPGDCVVIGYADGCPGYLPPAEEFPHGGYEAEEAHHYYGMPSPFAPGAAETLADFAVALAAGI
jgi:neutral ceramidase